MRKIGILVSNIYKFGGVQEIVGKITNGLLEENLNIEVISIFKTNEVANITDNVIVKNIIDGEVPFRKRSLYIANKTKKFFGENNFDIVIVAGTGLLPVVYLSLRSSNIRIIAWDHQGFNVGKKFGYEWIGRRIASYLCEKTIVITEENYNSYRRKLKAKSIVKIYNAIGNIDEDIEYSLKSKKIISCGRLEYEKGFDILVDVAKQVLNKKQGWEWHIWGEGSQREELEKKIKGNRLEDKVKLCGYTKNINEKYNEYAMYVMTSRFEGFGLVLVEAQVNKLPVISFNCESGPKEIIRNNKNGFLVEDFDEDEMVKKINLLIDNLEKRIEFSENSRVDLDRFKLDNIVRQWIEVIGSI